MHEFRSMIREVAEQVASGVRTLMMGVTTSVDQGNSAVKATYQPANVESGFMPHMTPLAGNGTGIIAIPPPGVQVVIGHEQGDAQAGVVLGCIWDNNNRPPAAYKPGEVWLASLGGAIFKVTNDGNVTMIGGTITLTGAVTINGDVTVNGKVTATGEGTFAGGHTVSAHTHGGVSAGLASTAAPTG